MELMTESYVRLECFESVAILYLDKPPVNAIDLKLLSQAEDFLLRIEKMENIRAVVITGMGKYFSAGLDLKVVPSYGPAEQREMIQAINRAIGRLYTFPMPTVAAINGHMIAGGFVLAMACDYRVGTNSPCEIGLTEARAGIPFPAAVMVVVKAELTAPVARKLILVSRNIGPQEAHAYNVLDELRPANQVLERAKEVALDLGGIPGKTYTQIKRHLRAEAIRLIENIVNTGSDPLLDSWIGTEGKEASKDLLTSI